MAGIKWHVVPMKAFVRFIVGVLFVLSVAASQAQSVQQGVDSKNAATPSVSRKNTPSAPKPADKKKADPMGKIDGIAIARPNGTYLGLNAASGIFCLSFYDAKKKPISCDVARASARWQSPKLRFQSNEILNPSSDGKALFGGKPVVPPRYFKVYLSLLDANGQVTESYVVDYHD